MEPFIKFAYLIAAALFILGLKGLGHPRTAVRGNLLGAIGMGIAILATLFTGTVGYLTFIIAALIGGAGGFLLATRIQMTEMPQMVALLNGFGGIASLLVAGAALHTAPVPDVPFGFAGAISGLVGGVTFTGSLIAFCKLHGVEYEHWLKIRGSELPSLQKINFGFAGACGLFALAIPVLCFAFGAPPEGQIGANFFIHFMYWLLVIAAFGFGIFLVHPIGGADMPVVIALLNSYSGLAAAATGFVIDNTMLIIAGSLVGASGVILTNLMCRAMNRSILNVLFGGMGSETSKPHGADDDIYKGRIKSTSAEEIALLFDDAQRVVIVPGYGMAVAQAQHPVKELMQLLQKKGIEVEFGIHPVAGRMPGHMNVLLAEAEVPYELLKDMDEINPTFKQTDVVIVIGANDVVNPVANTDPRSPIAGMPILNVYDARTVVVVKRSLSPGFAKIPNPLFAKDNTLMFFADGRRAMTELVQAVKES